MSGVNTSFKWLSPPPTAANTSQPCPIPEPVFSNVDFSYCLGEVPFEVAFRPESGESYYIPAIVIYSLTFFFGIFTNIMITYVLLMDIKLTNSVSSRFLTSLTTADTLFLLLCAPYELLLKNTEYVKDGNMLGNFLCKSSSFIEMTTTAASVFNLSVVSFERSVLNNLPCALRTIIKRN